MPPPIIPTACTPPDSPVGPAGGRAVPIPWGLVWKPSSPAKELLFDWNVCSSCFCWAACRVHGRTGVIGGGIIQCHKVKEQIDCSKNAS